MTPPRGIRNNNPGNMEPGGWFGETGNDGRFAIFDTMQNGIRALSKQLIVYQTKYGVNTVAQAINRWAPSNENQTSAYIALVCSVLNCNADDNFNFSDPDFLYWMVTAIGEEENGHTEFSQYVSDADIWSGVRAALS